MYLEAFVLGSEAVGDAGARDKAYRAFHEFCDYTLHNGFTEFNATNYYKINLHCLGSMAGGSADPEVRRRAAAFAEFLWLDAALHYWPFQDWLTGANSRTYNYIGGVGGALGLLRPFFNPSGAAPPQGGEAGWIASFDYVPPSYIREIAREKVETVYRGLWLAPEADEFRRGFEGEGFQRVAHGEFGHAYGKDRYTYIEPAYTLGTGGAQYCSQDRMLVADIASRKNLASISSQINTRLPLDEPGEFLSFLGNNRHIHTGGAAVQHRNLALILYSLALPKQDGGRLRIVAHLLLLPANADGIFIGARAADRGAGPHPLSAADVLYVQEGETYAALRFVEANEGFDGYRPTYHYRLDGDYKLAKEDRRFPVGAMSCVLYDGAEKLLMGRNVRAGFVVEMATRKQYPSLADFRGHIEKQTAVSQSVEKGIWQVRYRSGASEIAISKDLASGAILDKRVNGERVAPPVHATSFSELTDGVLTVTWKGRQHAIDLRRQPAVKPSRSPSTAR